MASKSFQLWPTLSKLAPIFNLEAKSDLLVAVKCLETGIYGAYEKVLINLKGLNDADDAVVKYKQEADKIWQESQSFAKNIIELIQKRT